MKVFFAADHAGFALKEVLKGFVQSLGHEIEDQGAFSCVPEDDYPLIIAHAMRGLIDELRTRPDTKAIILGKSGQGEAIAGNRIRGIRAVVYYGGAPEILKLSREHNNANVLSLGAGFLSEKEAQEAVQLWLGTLFSGEERHLRRIAQLDT